MTRQQQSPGVPQLLRLLNDRAALNLLFTEGPKTRAQLADATSLSKVTASQMVERLESRGLIEAVGTRAGNRGPNATVYAVVGGYAHVAGIEVGAESVSAACCDLVGNVVGRAEIETNDEEPGVAIRRAVAAVAHDAKIEQSQLWRVMLATPGLIDPVSNDVGFAWDLPTWHRGVRDALQNELQRPVVIENDVNLAAVAEHRDGAAKGTDDVVYVWFGRGLGLGVILGGKLHRGVTGGAGEIGYLTVPGSPLPDDFVKRRAKGSFQRFVGADAVVELAEEYGISAASASEAVGLAHNSGDKGERFFEVLATRMATGVASICAVLDPSLVVVGGEVGYAGGQTLASLIGAELPRIVPMSPRVVAGALPLHPVLQGAIRMSLDVVREELFATE